MKNLKKQYDNMIVAGVYSNTFSLLYNRHGFSCIVIIQDYGCSLYISTLGDTPKTIAIDMPTDFSAPNYIDPDGYRILAQYLGFTGSSNNRFIPARFFEEFDSHIPQKPKRIATEQEKIRVIGRSANIKEEDKVFFCGWRNNGKAGSVTEKNYAKTRKIVGEEMARQLRTANISSCWTCIADDENLARLNDYLHLLHRAL